MQKISLYQRIFTNNQKQCREPEKKKKSNKTYLHEMTRWVINSKKWEAATKYAKKQNWEFKILTEKTLNL